MKSDSKYSSAQGESALCQSCAKNADFLIIPKKTVSISIACLLLIFFFIFAAGYFMGKKKLAHDFCQDIERTSFSDQLNYALNAAYDKQPAPLPSTIENQEIALVESAVVETAPAKVPITVAKPTTTKWAAQLMGGSQKDVTAFANRLLKHGISVIVKKRTGRTAHGNPVYWYQAVTQPFENQEELKKIVERIKKLENIKITSNTIVQLA